MPTTSNFGWTTPADTDLVKDGALAIRTLGNAIDTSMAELKGGTTGQVLSKTSNTDMDFTWVTQDDANAIQNAIVDAKGDLIAATANDTPARLAVGSNGETLVADSASSVGLRYQANFAAGKNKIINGDFSIWQRGTSFSPVADIGLYTADRWFTQRNGSGYTATISRQSFTPGTAPVAGYESQYFLRYNVAVAGTSNTYAVLDQRIEDVRTLAGQTVSVSFWAKADTTRSLPASLVQDFGVGGSGAVGTSLGTFNLTTNWQRFTATVSNPSIAGKTIGTNNFLYVRFDLPAGAITPTVDFWGVQVEAGNVATAFQTATGTLQGELAACQRYYYRLSNGTVYTNFGLGIVQSSTLYDLNFQHPVTMRVTPTVLDFSNLTSQEAPGGALYPVTAATLNSTAGSPSISTITMTVASGLTTNRPIRTLANNNAAAFIGVSAEL